MTYLAIGVTTASQVQCISGLGIQAVGRPNHRMTKSLQHCAAVAILRHNDAETLEFLHMMQWKVVELTEHQRLQGLHRLDRYEYNEEEFETLHALRVEETLLNLIELHKMKQQK